MDTSSSVVAVVKKPVKKTAKKAVKKKAKASAPIAQVAKKITATDNIKRNPLGHLLMEKMMREAGFRGSRQI